MTKEVFLKRYDQINKNYINACQKTKEYYITMMWAENKEDADMQKVNWLFWLRKKQIFERAKAMLIYKYDNSL